jgi:hypothetical protein
MALSGKAAHHARQLWQMLIRSFDRLDLVGQGVDIQSFECGATAAIEREALGARPPGVRALRVSTPPVQLSVA